MNRGLISCFKVNVKNDRKDGPPSLTPKISNLDFYWSDVKQYPKNGGEFP